jgi:hypothetical protein
MRTWLARGLIAVGLFGASAGAIAQPRPAPAGDKRENLKKRIRVMRAYELTDALQLDETTTGRLFPILAKYDDITDKLLAQRGELQKRLEAPPADARATDKLIDDSITNQRDLWDAQDKRLAEIRKVLTPAQTAKLLVVLPEIEKQIGNRLRAAAAGKGGAGGRGRPGAGGRGGSKIENPFDEDDESLSPPGSVAPRPPTRE